jgi:peroxiredoxin
MSEFEAQGIRPVAISVDSPDASRDFVKRRGFTFTVLSDPKAEVIGRYALLHVAGGPEKQDISRPTEYLIDRSETIRWVNFTNDLRVRARADEMSAAARAIK